MRHGWAWLFVVADILIVGGFLMILPRISRRGLLFGVYVGEDATEGETAERIRGAWYREMSAVVAVTLLAAWAVGGAVGEPLAGLGAQVILLAAFFAVYVRAHRRARRLARPVAPASAAAPEPTSEGRRLLLPHVATFVGLAVGLCVVGYAWAIYPSLPERIPTHFGPSGVPDAWGRRSFASVMLLPLMTLVMGAGLGGLSYLIARAKRAVRWTDRGVSLAAQERFRAAVTRFFCGMAMLLTAMLGVGSVLTLQVALGRRRGLGWGFGALSVVMVAYVLGGIIYLAVRYGQGGARLETGAGSAPLTDGLADNRRWVLGLFYVNRDDPSLVVEHRFGLGYTLNLGNPKAVALLVVFLVLIAAILAVALSA